MTRVYVTDKREVRELACKADGIDFIDEIIGGHNDEGKYDTARDDAEWQMPESEYVWWEEWAYREERIIRRASELGEDAIKEVTRLAVWYGSDLDALHDAQESYLGIRDA